MNFFPWCARISRNPAAPLSKVLTGEANYIYKWMFYIALSRRRGRGRGRGGTCSTLYPDMYLSTHPTCQRIIPKQGKMFCVKLTLTMFPVSHAVAQKEHLVHLDRLWKEPRKEREREEWETHTCMINIMINMFLSPSALALGIAIHIVNVCVIWNTALVSNFGEILSNVWRGEILDDWGELYVFNNLTCRCGIIPSCTSHKDDDETERYAQKAELKSNDKQERRSVARAGADG